LFFCFFFRSLFLVVSVSLSFATAENSSFFLALTHTSNKNIFVFAILLFEVFPVCEFSVLRGVDTLIAIS